MMSAQGKTANRFVACLGPEGSYSYLAAKALCPDLQCLLCRNFSEVFKQLTSGQADCAVVPVENSIRGGILQNLDLLEEQPVFAVAEYVLPIDHRLVTRGKVDEREITHIYSHEQALGQCSEYIEAHFPHAKCVCTHSTAECLSQVGGTSAGIIGAHISGEGLVLSDCNIANDAHNVTRFLLLKRREEVEIEHSEKVFFCAVCAHKPGALAELLQIFAGEGINLTRIESRPVIGEYGEYLFFVEFDGDIACDTVRTVLSRAERICRKFRLLGAYNEKPLK